MGVQDHRAILNQEALAWKPVVRLDTSDTNSAFVNEEGVDGGKEEPTGEEGDENRLGRAAASPSGERESESCFLVAWLIGGRI